MEVKSNKLQAKDLINVGIFTAIYFVIFFAGMMLGYIPIFIPLLGLVCPILCGIPFMLYLTKVKRFGMVSLTGVILGLINLIAGSGIMIELLNINFRYAGGSDAGGLVNINLTIPDGQVKTAEADACRIEHLISDESFQRLKEAAEKRS